MPRGGEEQVCGARDIPVRGIYLWRFSIRYHFLCRNIINQALGVDTRRRDELSQTYLKAQTSSLRGYCIIVSVMALLPLILSIIAGKSIAVPIVRPDHSRACPRPDLPL